MGNQAGAHHGQHPSRSEENEFEIFLKATETECTQLLYTISNIRQQNMPTEEKRKYVGSLLSETAKKIRKAVPSESAPQPKGRQVQDAPEQGAGGRSPRTIKEQTIKRLLEEKLECDQKITNLYKQIASLEVEKDLSDLRTKVHSLQQENDSLGHQLKTAKHERDNLSERLSKIIGQKIRENNPDIVDLSDPCRPTKLAEIYTELYDNEWTNAYEALTQSGYDEQHAVETLELTLLDCWEFSQRTFTGIVSKLDEVILDMMKLGSEAEQKEQKHSSATMIRKDPYKGKDVNYKREHLQKRWIPKTGAQQVVSHEAKKGSEVLPVGFKLVQDEERKMIANKLVLFVQNAYFKTLLTMDGVPPQIKAFIKRCLFFSWMAVAQSPPLWLDDVKPGTPLDNKLYKEYTRRGEKIEFIVWPALRLHQNGQVLAKGVAQGSATQK